MDLQIVARRMKTSADGAGNRAGQRGVTMPYAWMAFAMTETAKGNSSDDAGVAFVAYYKKSENQTG